MRTRTKLLAAMLACLMFLTVGSAFAEGETVTINFWHHYSAQSAENETLMNVLIPAFEAENPGIKVNAVWLAAILPGCPNSRRWVSWLLWMKKCLTSQK